jgi:hypothetical protein
MNSTNPNDNSSALRTLLDRAEITQVVQDWGLARDTCRWEKLRSFHTADGKVQTTWFVGSAFEFVERSRQAAAAGAQVQHFIGAATIELSGGRAVAETRMVLQVRAAVHGVPVDVTCYGLFHDLFVRNADGWRIQQRVPVYEKDRIDTLVPGQKLELDAERLAALPDGCRHLTYVQSLGGAQITPDLPVPGTAALERLYAQGRDWLSGTAPG